MSQPLAALPPPPPPPPPPRLPHPHPTHLRTTRPDPHLFLPSPQVRITLSGAHFTPESSFGLFNPTPRVGCLPSELQKHNATLMRRLASRAYQQVP